MGISGHASSEAIQGVTVAFTIVALLIIVARLLTRTLISKQAGLDDAFIGIAGVFTLCMCITTYLQAHYGMGKHAWSFPQSTFATITMHFWTATWTYYAALGFTKLSILLQYLRIFPQPWFRRACYVMMAVNVIWSLWAVLSTLILCVPISKFWTHVVFDTPHCLNRLYVWYADAAINIVTDCIVVLLPLPIINSLEVPHRQKNLLLGVFGIGFLTCIISVLRLAYIYPVSISNDMTWESPLICIWSAVETNVGILCSCMPTLKGGIQRVWPQFLDSLASARSARESSNASGSVSKRSFLMGKRSAGSSGLASEKEFASASSSSDEESGLSPKTSAAPTALPAQQPHGKQNASGFARLGFRRSFFSSPFTSLVGSGTRASFGTPRPAYTGTGCFGTTSRASSSDEPITSDCKNGTSTLQRSATNKEDADRAIEVRTVVDQVSEIRNASPSEAPHAPVAGEPTGVRQPPSLTTLAQGNAGAAAQARGRDGRESRAESTRTVVEGPGGVIRGEGVGEVERLAWV